MTTVAADFRGEVGERVESAPVPVRFETMAEYTRSVSEPGYERSIHTDLEIARQYGLDEPIAEGRMWTTLLSTLLGTALGRAWLSTGVLSLTFIKMVKPGDLIKARGVVTLVQTEPGGRRVQFEVWCENQRGENVAVGNASCLIDRGLCGPLAEGRGRDPGARPR